MKTPDFWVQLVRRPYPSGTAITTRYGTKAMAWPTFVEGRVLAGGFSNVTHALSDWKGNPETSTLSVQLEDQDGAIRQIADEIGNTAYLRCELSLMLLSEAGRHAGLTPRTVYRGFLSSAPTPKSGRKAEMIGVDIIGSHSYRLYPEAVIQKVFWTREFLEAAGLVNTPKSVLKKPANIIIGEHSDLGALNANGTSAEKGMVPVDDLGDVVSSSTGTVAGQPGVKAYAFFNFSTWATDNFADGDTVTIGTATYIFESTFTNTANKVLIGANGFDSKYNLCAAASGGAGSGTVYGDGTVRDPNIDTFIPDWIGGGPNTGAGQAYTVKAQYVVVGVIGNASLVGDTAANARWFTEGAIITTTLTFGSDPVVSQTIPAPIVTLSVVGTPGTTSYAYEVAMVTSEGETVGSAVVTTDVGPDVLDASNYIQLSWVPPAGWESTYTALAVYYKVFGRTTNPSTAYLKLVAAPTVTYQDTGADTEKAPGPKAVGTATVVLTTSGDPSTVTTSTSWGLLVYGLGYCALLSVFGSNVAVGAAPARVQLDPDDPDLMTPLSANWPYADPWITLIDEDGNPVRVSGFYAKGVRLSQHRDGTCTFAVNCCGVTDTGDNTGETITEASEGYKWLVNELLLKNNGAGYRSGPFWPLEAFSDGVTVLNTDLLDTFQLATVGFIGGRGYQMHLCLTEPCTVSQFHQWFNLTFTCFTGAIDNGQLGIWVIDTNASVVGTTHYRRNIELLPSLPDCPPMQDEVENDTFFVYDWDPDAQAYRGDPEHTADATSKQLYGERKSSDTQLELRCTRDRATARDAMSRRMLHQKNPPVYQQLPTGRWGIEQRVGTIIRVTHQDGPTVDGWSNRPFFIVRKIISDVGTERMRVTLVGRDIAKALEFSPSSSPSHSLSSSPSISTSRSPSLSISPSLSASKSPSVSVSPSTSTSMSPSSSISPSLSPSKSPSASLSPSLSASISPSASLSPSKSASASPSASLSPSKSPSSSPSRSVSPSKSTSSSPSVSVSPSRSTSASPSVSPSRSASISSSLSPSMSRSVSPSRSASVSPSVSPSASPSPSA